MMAEPVIMVEVAHGDGDGDGMLNGVAECSGSQNFTGIIVVVGNVCVLLSSGSGAGGVCTLSCSGWDPEIGC